jgi:hypothetical protein
MYYIQKQYLKIKMVTFENRDWNNTEKCKKNFNIANYGIQGYLNYYTQILYIKWRFAHYHCCDSVITFVYNIIIFLIIVKCYYSVSISGFLKGQSD